VNCDNSHVVTITVTCNLWTPSSGDHLFTCGPSTCRHTYYQRWSLSGLPVGYPAG